MRGDGVSPWTILLVSAVAMMQSLGIEVARMTISDSLYERAIALGVRLNSVT